ncbi:MAG: hypothetical protein IJS50_02580, partial [Desulfovibrio sp.]|nr:hypothetical protein [Desulfovibrio sp.]
LARRLQTAIVMVSHDVNLVDEFHFQKLAINVERSSLGTTSVLDDGVSLEQSKDWQINTSTNNHKKLPSATNLLLPNKGAKLPQGVGL